MAISYCWKLEQRSNNLYNTKNISQQVAKKAQATKKSAEQAVSISRLKLNQLFFESLLIVQGFLGLFVLISLITFSPQDPGWNSQTFSNSLVGEEFGI